MSVTHLASFTVIFQGRLIQRCAICGEKLEDVVIARCAFPDSTPPEHRKPPQFPVNRLVQKDGNFWTVLEQTDKFPDDICWNLVEQP